MTSKRTHRAAAGLLALAMPLAQGAGAVVVHLESRHAESSRTTMASPDRGSASIARDLSLASAYALVLPRGLRGEVHDAIGSARAATDNAADALQTAGSATDEDLRWRAEIALQDALTALSAASAELTFVLSRVEGIDAGVTFSLRALHADMAALAEDAARAGGAPA